MWLLAGCPATRSPQPPGLSRGVAEATLEIGQTGRVLTGIAGDGATVYAALTAHASAGSVLPATARSSDDAAARSSDAATSTSTTTIEAIRIASGATPTWRTELAGHAGPLAIAGAQLVAAFGGTGSVAGATVRGEPGAVIVALDARTGAPGWKLAIDATEWAMIAAIAAAPDGIAPDGIVVGGAFSGTLRIGPRVVSSAGLSDGFVARITAGGEISWLVRIGGPGADAVRGVAADADRIAVAGTFAAGADLLGEPLPAIDERSPRSDGFVAELDAAGARRWVQCFGGDADDAVAGVAIDARGRVVVAATARGTVRIAGDELTARGSADGLVVWWSPDGTRLGAVLLGGDDFDGLAAIVPAGERVIAAGFYAGAIRLGDRALTAGAGDAAFLAELDATGRVARAWSLGGDGREEIAALAAIRGGVLAGVAHTADLRLDGATLPAPAEPMAGAAILVRAAD